MDKTLEEYLKEKYGDQYDLTARQKYDDKKNQIDTGSVISSLGDTLAGRSPGSNTQYYQGLKDQAKSDTIGKIDADRKSFMETANFENKQKDAQTKQAAFDPNSSQSVSFRKMMEAKFPEVSNTYGDAWSNVSAGDMENIFKPLQLKEQMEARKEQARILAGQRTDAAETRKALQTQRLDEKMQALKTPFGIANTEDDAKKLKEAHESKSNFDSKINEMIKLREKHKGGNIFNREDVARGKQLSKDLLLEYKNMAKLGVLSQSDENIINAIIPEDPLEFNSIAASLQGQDPVLHKLKSFKGDSDKDFLNRIATRTRGGVENAAKPQQEKTIVKTQTNQKTGQKRIVYSDGSVEVVNFVAGGM